MTLVRLFPHTPVCISNRLLDRPPWMQNRHFILRTPHTSYMKLLSYPLKPAAPATPHLPKPQSFKPKGLSHYSSFSLRLLIQCLRKSVGSLLSHTWNLTVPHMSCSEHHLLCLGHPAYPLTLLPSPHFYSSSSQGQFSRVAGMILLDLVRANPSSSE